LSQARKLHATRALMKQTTLPKYEGANYTAAAYVIGPIRLPLLAHLLSQSEEAVCKEGADE
jgi:hypothetical protein